LNVHRVVSGVRQTEIHRAEPLVPDLSPCEVKTVTAKLKRYKLPGSDQIPTEMIQAGGETLWPEIHKLINCIWNKGELPDKWNVSIIVPVHKNCDKTDCSHYRGISLLSTLYNILSNILRSKLSSHIDEIIGDHQCGF
jgi:hypothetical protein